jgi:nucleoside-diphosphate-sugar epimerase
MKVLLTGATGFIGSHVARRLAADGHEVHAVIRPGSRTWRLADVLERLRVETADALNRVAVEEAVRRVKPECCVHLAWCAEPGVYLTSRENVSWMDATLRLAASLADAGCRRFVGAGTCFEYDLNARGFSESTATAPRSLYAACKLGTWLPLEQLGKLTGMSVAWARFFYQYGPGEDPRRLVASVIRALAAGQPARITEGAQVRDFLHVADVASAVAAVAAGRINGPVNVGSGEPVTVRDIVGRIGRIMGRSELIAFGALPYGPGDPMHICADNALLVSQTGWRPAFGLEEGLRQTVAWWQEHLARPEPGRTPGGVRHFLRHPDGGSVVPA